MSEIRFGIEYLKELEGESRATRKCLERIPVEKFSWKPHEKSMELGYLAILVAEIPRWIASIVEDGVIDLATYGHPEIKTTADLVKYHDDNMDAARRALNNVENDALKELFHLKANGETLFSSSKKDNVSSAINHQVHHRGQLTVYMRLNDIPVPSIYGPSADDRSF